MRAIFGISPYIMKTTLPRPYCNDFLAKHFALIVRN